jgi:hypothetical protein
MIQLEMAKRTVQPGPDPVKPGPPGMVRKPVRAPLQIHGSWRTGHCLVHTGQSGVPCRPLERATHRPPISLSTVAQSTVGSPDSPVHHRTVR